MLPVIVLDYDGTLHECLRIYKPAFLATYEYLVRLGYVKPRVFEDAEISCWLGISVKDMWNGFMPKLPEEVKRDCAQMTADHMSADVACGRAVLYPGVMELLEGLKKDGFTLVFLSNCKHAYMELHKEHFKLDRFFDAFYCTEDFNFAPKHEIFEQIKKDFASQEKTDFIIAGDRFKDMEISRLHKLPSVGCTYGYGSIEELNNASLLARSVQELGEQIRVLAKRKN